MIAVGFVMAALWVAFEGPKPVVVGSTVVAAAVHPLLGISVAATWVGAQRVRKIAVTRTSHSNYADEAVLAVELAALGVSSGVSFAQAAHIAADFVDQDVAVEIRRNTRQRSAGIGTTDDASVIGLMFEKARQSEASGASLASELRSLASEAREERAADRAARLAKLPVKLLFPLAFLILPGFLLVAVVPSVIGGLARLSL